jgi:mRNA-degrading endonuclease RelE of RelBE toxin-antitoxin system
VAYKVHVVTPAKREIKKLDRSTKTAVLKANLSLGENPRPDGYVPVVGKEGYIASTFLRLQSAESSITFTINTGR